jgi:hypothetical protein
MKNKLPFLILSSLLLTSIAYSADPIKVLYITHIPGKYHDYKAQQAEFTKYVPQYAHVDVTYQAEDLDKTLAFMKQPEFAKGYDVIVYNICLAHNTDTDLAHNMIEQTRTHGIPAVLVHCSMHTFWATFGTPDSRGAEKQAELQKNWLSKNPDTAFPNWSDFSGLDTKKHDHQRPLTLRRAEPIHPIVANFPQEWKIEKDELYQNVDFKNTATPILIAYSETSNKDHVIAWENKAGKSTAIGITIGHGMETFVSPRFHRFLANSILHLSGNIGADGKAKAGYGGSGK